MHLLKITGSDSLPGTAPSVARREGQHVRDGTEASSKLCAQGKKWHTWVLSKPNLSLEKPKRAFVLSSSVMPGINDTDKSPRKSLFAFQTNSSTTLSCLSAHGTALQTAAGLGIT